MDRKLINNNTMKKILFLALMLISVVGFSQDKGSYYLGFIPKDTTFFNVGGVNLVTAHIQEWYVRSSFFYKVKSSGVEIYMNKWDRVWTDTTANWQNNHLSESYLLEDRFTNMIYKNEIVYNIVGTDTTILTTPLNIWRMLVGQIDAVDLRDSIKYVIKIKHGLE